MTLGEQLVELENAVAALKVQDEKTLAAKRAYDASISALEVARTRAGTAKQGIRAALDVLVPDDHGRTRQG